MVNIEIFKFSNWIELLDEKNTLVCNRWIDPSVGREGYLARGMMERRREVR